MAEQVSLKKNFAYKGLLTVATPIMGMITFPYISRVLGVENVGLVNFVDNTISYFLLFASMGITNLGVRAIAAAKHSQDELNKTFSNIFGLNIIFTAAVLAIYCTLIAVVPKFNSYSELFYIGGAKILFTSLLIEWFFSGIENFKFITLRSLAVRLLYVISIFLFIRDAEDYRLYFILTTSVTVVNAIINQSYSRKYVKIVPSELMSRRFLKENLDLGIYAIMTSMYLSFNVMYLGLVSDNTEVGYYTSAFKLYHLILSVFSAFTSVMLPRMSSLAAIGDKERFNYLINKSVDFVALVSIPLIVCCSIMAPEIIYLLCGQGYEGAILPMRIIMPAILFVGIAQILALQILMPLKKDKILLYTSIAGAVLSVMINICAVSRLESIGSAIVMLSSEIIVTSIYLAYSARRHIAKIRFGAFVGPIFKTTPCVMICLICKCYIDNPYLSLIVAACTCVLIYLSLNLKEFKSLTKK